MDFSRFTTDLQNSSKAVPAQGIWIGFWALMLSLGWLLTNHYYPWLNFHSDFWIAAATTVAGAVVFARSRQAVWPWICVAVLGCAAIPWIQFAYGALPFIGQAWVNSAYLLGFGMAILLGAHWERLSPGQGPTALFLAIGIAAVASVGVQCYQWLIVGHEWAVWLLAGPASRPYANFAQPNLLATFLLWGLVACAWGLLRGKIRLPMAIVMACVLLLGIALTRSRTALVALIVIVLACWLWRPLRTQRRAAGIVTALGVFYLVCLVGMDSINTFLLLDVPPNDFFLKVNNESRRGVYVLFWDAVWQRPWAGYGWGETVRAQLAVAREHPAIGTFFHAHNLFLDLMLWCGVVAGGLLAVLCIFWFVTRARAVASTEDALLVLFVGCVGWHSMTELPLHYANMLLPTGLVMGVLEARLKPARLVGGGRVALLVLWCVAAAVLGTLGRDYIRIENSFLNLRLERAGLVKGIPREPPEVVMLTQMREYIRTMRTGPKVNMTPSEIGTMRELAQSFPSEATMYNLIYALAANGRPDEAGQWVAKFMKITGPEQYAYVRSAWAADATRVPQLSAVPWPPVWSR